MSTPYGIASAGSNLFVVNGNGVGQYTLTGALVNAALIIGLSSPACIAVVVPEPSSYGVFAGLGLVALSAIDALRRKQLPPGPPRA